MENNKIKIFTQFVAGVFGGSILSITGEYLATKGGISCWLFINFIFQTNCYEWQWYFEPIIGVILGITVISKIKIANYSRVAFLLLLGLFVFPLYIIILSWPDEEKIGFLVIFYSILLLYSSISSLFIVGIINWRKFLRGKQKYITGAVVLLIIILGFAFYWYFYRPEQIRKQCERMSQIQKDILGNTYRSCLHSKGLEH